MNPAKPLSEMNIVHIIADILENALCSLDEYRLHGTASLEKWFEPGSIFCSVAKQITNEDYLQYIWYDTKHDVVVINPSLTVFVSKDSKMVKGGMVVGFKITNFAELAKTIRSIFKVPLTENDKDILQLLDNRSVKLKKNQDYPYPGEEK